MHPITKINFVKNLYDKLYDLQISIIHTSLKLDADFIFTR